MYNMAIAVACEHISQPTSSGSMNNARIGARIIGCKNKKSPSTSQEKTLHYGDRIVSGIALCFGGNDVFYVSLKQGMVLSKSVPLSIICVEGFIHQLLLVVKARGPVPFYGLCYSVSL
jgi:hypothetical protein